MRYTISLAIFMVATLLAQSSMRGYLSVQFPDDPSKRETVSTFEYEGFIYVSAKDLAKVLSAGVFINQPRGKIEIKLGKHRIKISGGSSFVVINGTTYQLPSYALFDGDDVFIPAASFFSLVHRRLLPGLTYDSSQRAIIVEMLVYNIKSLAIEEKANGTIVRIKTSEVFEKRDLTGWAAANGWFYLTIAGGMADSTAVRQARPGGIIRTIDVDQIGKTTQIGFQLRSRIDNHELYVNNEDKEIVLTLRSPLSHTAEKIKAIRDRWYIDTIVLDAGHGGKDAGTSGTYGLKEKFVTLDITRRVGRLLEKYANVKVVYTHDEDVFVPIWKRSKIANETGGKLFISVHANANKNRRVRGFETYILRPGRTEDAIEVARRENQVIKLEEESSHYEKMEANNLILASLMQNAFMKESEDLASMIQRELRKSIPSPDRGVKQAGFYVLIGASMPNILVEVGFLSNPQEEKQLRKPGYRQTIAEAIYNGIRRFKDKYERVLIEEAKG